MKILRWVMQRRARFIALFGLTSIALLVLPGCGRDEVQTYRVPKENVAQAPHDPHGGMHAGHGHGDMAAAPKLEYKAPNGWQEAQLGSMRAAHFIATGKNGQKADISAIALPGATAPTRDIVNMWREQVKLKPLEETEFSSTGEKVQVGAVQGELYDLIGQEPVIEEKFKARTIAAILKRDQTLWVFKMIGETEAVGEQKSAFLEFLKSIQFQDAPKPGPEMAVAPQKSAAISPSTSAPEKPTWQAPPTWKEQPPTQMLVAKFVTGDEKAQAEITVSTFPGDVGGLLANVNRWRGQIGLGTIEDSELSKYISSVDVFGGKAILVDLTGTNPRTSQKARLLGAIVQRGDQTWFYKMLGEEQLAAREKETFVKFVQSVRYPNAG